MRQFSLSPIAKRDLAEIWNYIAKDSIEYADQWLARAYEIFQVLAVAPAIGPKAEEIKPGTRRFPLGNYIVYYRITTRGVQILRVFHGKRNQRAAFYKQ